MGNFKVRCISDDGSDWFTKGKIYEVKNSHIENDAGDPNSGGIDNLDNLNLAMMAEFELIQSPPQHIIINQQSNTVTATLKQGKEVVKTEKAKCSPDDTFEFGIGAKLAVERLFGLEKINADWIKVDGIKEVKRPAKVGEWVKIVDTKRPKTYLNGDIYQVQHLQNCLDDGVGVGIGKAYVALLDEYIVLENYHPSTTTPSESTPPQINYSEIDYTKLDGQRLFEEVKRRVRENG